VARTRAKKKTGVKRKAAKKPVRQPTPTAKDVMNPVVLTVRDDMTVRELATFLTENEISGAPVLDPRGKLAGVVSLRDIVESTAEGAEETDERPRVSKMGWGDRMTPSELSQMHLENEGLLVREIMTPSVYTVTEDTPVAKVAETMIRGHIHRLVVTRRREAVGIISTLDLLGLLTKEGTGTGGRPGAKAWARTY
jgi:CBS domain-containing protein